ncbi:hypothetical protein BU23DRAFT_32809 [Bimuria novae-zelandiae CBS 107.79]|uniref:Uncharacterized protein n=1 Tax=Bimuria novae-zelandiae CBS 107.79 TaxID=1447943 RepID=A0A6A5UN84_9PLEO|nr:hypothetical protein BU23DRAFT_32809 [Bimuria novae-zelandiae CBS 107.79]
MDKHRNDSLCTLDFSPILYVLRARNPSLSITFNLSFDTILWYHWDHGEWLEFAGRAVPWPTDEHQPMGYVDISDLMAPPSEDDVAYVTEHLEEYWTEKKMPQNRNIRDGLLDESPSNWRVLAKNYAVKEPLLLRCRMKEQFEVYRRYRMGVGEKDRGE